MPSMSWSGNKACERGGWHMHIGLQNIWHMEKRRFRCGFKKQFRTVVLLFLNTIKNYAETVWGILPGNTDSFDMARRRIFCTAMTRPTKKYWKMSQIGWETINDRKGATIEWYTLALVKCDDENIGAVYNKLKFVYGKCALGNFVDRSDKIRCCHWPKARKRERRLVCSTPNNSNLNTRIHTYNIHIVWIHNLDKWKSWNEGYVRNNWKTPISKTMQANKQTHTYIIYSCKYPV